MRMAIFTHVPHFSLEGRWSAYGPYVREMNSWAKFADQFLIVSPVKDVRDPIDLDYQGVEMEISAIKEFSLVSIKEIMRACWLIPGICRKIYFTMKKADHLHLRCPGNVGLLACLVQVLFPSKPKTAKYAGNWDPKAKQPRSYRFQKWLLSNTFLTRNMQVLVYGDWPGQSKNIKPFFTATYRDKDKEAISDRSFVAPWRFVFVGTLSAGKQPVYAAQLLSSLGPELDWTLDFYGEGEMREKLEEFIFANDFSNRIKLHGNVPQQELKEALSQAHCLVLPSLSEGWPKVVAEAMWWGCIPLALPVSCVPWMLEEGDRGLLLSGDLLEDRQRLQKLLSDTDKMTQMAQNGEEWSRNYTMDLFEREIQVLLG